MKQLTAISLSLAIALLAGCATSERDTPQADAASQMQDPADVAADPTASAEDVAGAADAAIAQSGVAQAKAAPAKKPDAPKPIKGSVFSKVGFCDGTSNGFTESRCNKSKSMGESLKLEKKRPAQPATSAPTSQPTAPAVE